MYDNGDEEEILLVEFRKQQRLYAREGMYNTEGNPNQPAIQQPHPAPPPSPSTTKKDNMKRKTIQKQTKKKSGKKKTKKTKKTVLPTSKLHNTHGNTVVTYDNYTP